MDKEDAKRIYKTSLERMTDDQLSMACDTYIWLSAYANNNPGSDYHWKCDMTYDECKRRNKPEIYAKVHDMLMKEARENQ